VDCSDADNDLVFLREAEGALIPLPVPKKTKEAPASHSGNRTIAVDSEFASAQQPPNSPTP
jgi:hypothetical protein